MVTFEPNDKAGSMALPCNEASCYTILGFRYELWFGVALQKQPETLSELHMPTRKASASISHGDTPVIESS